MSRPTLQVSSAFGGACAVILCALVNIGLSCFLLRRAQLPTHFGGLSVLNTGCVVGVRGDVRSLTSLTNLNRFPCDQGAARSRRVRGELRKPYKPYKPSSSDL